MSTTTTEVKVGQVWADNDPRMSGRLVRVEALSVTRGGVEALPGRAPRYARCRTGWMSEYGFRSHHGNRSQTWIRLDRFRPTSTGYRLLEDVP